MKKLPHKWFPGWNASIALRKVDKWAEMHAKTGSSPYFDTWAEAYSYMLERAVKGLERAKKDLKYAERHLKKVQGMTEPNK